MYMEVKIKHFERPAYYLTLKAEILNWLFMNKAVNQTKLVSVRNGTVVKVFQAWQIEVGSIGPQSGPETWENTHTPITITLQKLKYTYMYKTNSRAATN